MRVFCRIFGELNGKMLKTRLKKKRN